MKLKAAAQWMLAILLMAPCMQAQSVWNTTHPVSYTHLIFVSGENLLTITSLSDTMDPETCGAGYQSTEQANGTVYPLAKTISFGLSVNF